MTEAGPLEDAAATPAGGLDGIRLAGANPIISSFPQGSIVVFDHDLRYLSAGGLGLAELGLSAARLQGSTIYEVFPPAHVAVLEPHYRLALAGHQAVLDVEYGGRTYLNQVAPVRDSDGRVIAGMAVSQDVTATRASQRALGESEERFRLAFEHAPIAEALTGLDGRFEQVNQAMCKMTGYSEAQLCAMTSADITHPDDVAADVSARQRLLTAEAMSCALEKRYLTATGQVVWGAKSIALLRRDDGSPLHFIVQVQDITRRKANEYLLSEERRRLRDAQWIGRIGSWEVDAGTNATTYSDAFLHLYGLDRIDAASLDEAAQACVHPDDRQGLIDAIRTCLRTGTAIRVRHRVTRANDGKRCWFDMRGEAIRAGGRVVRFAGAIADVTDQVVQEAEVKVARDAAIEASRQKSTFLATMSHEIRTPLNAVIGMTGLLLNLDLGVLERDYTETIRNSGDALLGIINNILDYSKIESGALELEAAPFDLEDLVEGALELVAAPAAQQQLDLLADIAADCPLTLVGDVTRLRQVVVNLLSNAVKFTPAGEVVVRVGAAEDTDGGLRLRVAVADTGIGIPADKMDRLFRSFSQVEASTTRTYGGTGLGLAISARLVQAMGGRIEVDSEPGHGSTFHFEIPIVRHDELVPRTYRAGGLKGRHVLVVDDNPTNRRILQRQLEGWGATADVAESGAEAQALVRDGRSYDVALLDLDMPSMNGIALAAWLRLQPSRRPLPLVLLSSHLRRSVHDRGDLFHSELVKPVTSAQLHRAVTSALGELTLPVDRCHPDAAAPPAPLMRVLVAEDNPINQRVAVHMLAELGYSSDVAGHGGEVLASLRGACYEVVLMDVQMPKMDGLEATRRIRAEFPADRQPVIVAMTANAMSDDRVECLGAGMDDYLSKPVRSEELAAVLEKWRLQPPRDRTRIPTA